MTNEELNGLLSAANGIDPRIQVNPATFQLWERVLGGKTFAEAWAALMLHYERPALPNRDRPPVDPPIIRKIIAEETERAIAKRAALEPPRREVRHSDYLRRTQSPEFIALFEQGRREGNAEREAATLRRAS